MNPTVATHENQQLRSGHALIVWSGLATWDAADLRFLPTDKASFESRHASIHSEFGRLLCWLAFSVGSEYLLKGVCEANGYLPPTHPLVFRPPEQSESLDEWVTAVLANDASVKERAPKYGTLGDVVPMIDKLLVNNVPLQRRTKATFVFLTKAIRNRDAHQYVRDVRAGAFHLVETLLVPSLNALIGTLDRDDLLSLSDERH